VVVPVAIEFRVTAAVLVVEVAPDIMAEAEVQAGWDHPQRVGR
jgi:hypothetical protein